VIQFVLNSVAWAVVVRALWPRLTLRMLIAPQMFRVVGMTLLATGVAGAGLDPAFRQSVAYGDLATAVLAIAAFATLPRAGGFVLATVATLLGLVDLVHNLARGLAANAAADLGGAWIIPSTIVPLMLVLHVAALVRLFSDRRAGAHHQHVEDDERGPAKG